MRLPTSQGCGSLSVCNASVTVTRAWLEKGTALLVIHIAAISQIRLDTDGRPATDANEPKAKKPLEAIRYLKRRISGAIHRRLLADAEQAAAQDASAGPGRALRDDSSIQRGRLQPHIVARDLYRLLERGAAAA